MEVTVVLATHGDQRWHELAEDRALPSAIEAGASGVVVWHDPQGTIARARNEAAANVQTEWLCFLDADDQLEPGYFDAMHEAAAGRRGSLLLAPAVRYVPAGAPLEECPPATLADRDMARLNPCVIGTVIRYADFRAVGAFWEWPAWEDWCLFRRIWQAGGSIVHVPDAVYRVNVNPVGRNAVPPDRAPVLHRRIRSAHAAWNRQRRNSR